MKEKMKIFYKVPTTMAELDEILSIIVNPVEITFPICNTAKVEVTLKKAAHFDDGEDSYV